MAPQWKRPERIVRPPINCNQRSIPCDDARKVRLDDVKIGARVERRFSVSELAKLGGNTTAWRGILRGVVKYSGKVPYAVVDCDDGRNREFKITLLRYENVRPN